MKFETPPLSHLKNKSGTVHMDDTAFVIKILSKEAVASFIFAVLFFLHLGNRVLKLRKRFLILDQLCLFALYHCGGSFC